MTVDLNILSKSLLSETEEARYKREIRDNSAEIARQLKETGTYTSPRSGLRITIPHPK